MLYTINIFFGGLAFYQLRTRLKWLKTTGSISFQSETVRHGSSCWGYRCKQRGEVRWIVQVYFQPKAVRKVCYKETTTASN